jgi:hypothetical protein
MQIAMGTTMTSFGYGVPRLEGPKERDMPHAYRQCQISTTSSSIAVVEPRGPLHEFLGVASGPGFID